MSEDNLRCWPQSFILRETCLLAAFLCVYRGGLELPGASPFSTSHVPKRVLGLQTCDTTFGFHWVPRICSQVIRLYQCPVSWPRNVLMSFFFFLSRSLIPTFIFCMCCNWGFLLHSPWWMLDTAPWALVVFISVQHVKTNHFLFRTRFFLWPFPEQNPIWARNGSPSLWLHTTRHPWSPTHLHLGVAFGTNISTFFWPIDLNLDH